jgi:rhamnosyltransferase
MNNTARVSVIIRNKNESQHLRLVLDALASQEPKPLETIIVDNESDDDSVQIAEIYGAKIVSIGRSAFTYGRALNLGLAQASGEICVILSAHALPLGSQFLKACAAPFTNERIAAVRCIYAGKRQDETRWMKPELLDSSSGISSVVKKGPLASGCAIRRAVWESVPFDEGADAAEEKLWALEVLKRGFLVHSPCEAVYAYLKPISALAAAKKNGREVLAMYKYTGMKLDFAARSTPRGLVDIGHVLFFETPRVAISALSRELVKSAFRFRMLFGMRK